MTYDRCIYHFNSRKAIVQLLFQLLSKGLLIRLGTRAECRRASDKDYPDFLYRVGQRLGATKPMTIDGELMLILIREISITNLGMHHQLKWASNWTYTFTV